MPPDVFFSGVTGRGQLHHGANLFTENRIRYSDYGRLGNRGMQVKRLFNLAR
jgi:hypothetical protein